MDLGGKILAADYPTKCACGKAKICVETAIGES